ncbi:uncharacterized protein LOC106152422 [Lingula anatina]|uniref:Uncharacterized protein LOC106152422 n=1 Tax=Lingula anatina TaxID=7574 RepID=A0A1S3H8I1_LINAN|nr:uncharacterized protein LOC106152422 [Lingula anatina]|eukprot:XP_013381439.1 uncharacterized protein LOC106152422 [Lingula anatina]
MANRITALLSLLVFSSGGGAEYLVGNLEGELNVDKGEVHYKIPLDLPPGPNNIQPDLAMTYSSGAGNGPLGIGWGLSLDTAIARCGLTIAQDGEIRGIQNDLTDRFCLDGQRLVLVSGTYGLTDSEYRTEVNSYSKVVAKGHHGLGPDKFIVHTKDGRKLTFGSSFGSKLIGNGQQCVHKWSISRIEDRFGNGVDITYSQPETEAGVLHHIRYGISVVEFQYELRPDKTTAYLQGNILFSLTKRLKVIKVFNQNNLIRSYKYTYHPTGYGGSKQSVLTALHMCDSQDKCLKPLSFNYGNTLNLDYTFERSTHKLYKYGKNYGWETSKHPRFIRDMDGDGFADIVGFPNYGVFVSLNDGNGGFKTPTYWSQEFGYTSGWRVENHPRHLADVDGDGLLDVVGFANGGVYVSFNTGTGLKSSRHMTSAFGYSRGWRVSNHPRFVMDINNDGRADIVGFANDGVYVSLSQGNNFDSPKLWSNQFGYTAGGWRVENHPRFLRDVNGDKLLDVVGFAADGVYVALNLGSSFGPAQKWIGQYGYTAGGWRTQQHPRFVEDINGDGLADIIGMASDGVYVSFSTGKYFTTSRKWIADYGVSAGGWSVTDHPRFLRDVTGDGLLDIVGFASNGIYVSENTGASFAQKRLWISAYGKTAGGWTTADHPRRVVDINGDGLPDIVGFANHGVYTSVNKNMLPAVHGIQDSLNNKIKIEYSPLGKALMEGAYKRDNDAVYPQQDVVLSRHIVRRVLRDDGIGGEAKNVTTYKYGGYKVDLSGRGSLGYRWIEETNTNSKIQYNEYEQSFPLTGMLKSSRLDIAVSSGDVRKVKLATYSNNVTILSSGSPARLGVFPWTQITENWDLNLKLVSTDATRYENADAFGNIRSILRTISGDGDVFEQKTENAYNNNAAHWFIGQLTESSVTHSTPSYCDMTRRTKFEYDQNRGQLIRIRREPDHALELMTEYTYDKYGNQIAQSETAAESPQQKRTTRKMYQSTGIFPVATINAMGHNETYVYDAFGNLERLVGANGLITSWEYDSLGRKVRENRADGTSTTWQYLWASSPVNAAYKVTKQVSGHAPETKIFDAFDREIRKESQGFNGTMIYDAVEYASDGNLHRESFPYFSVSSPKWSVYKYDLLDRVIEKEEPAGDKTAITRYEYDALVTKTIDPLGHASSKKTDILGRVVQVTDNLGGMVKHRYDPLDRLVQTVDPNNYSIEMGYDILGYKTSMSDPNMGSWEYRHNAFGELIWQKDANGNVLQEEYDLLGRLVKRTEPEGVTTWSYDTKEKGIGKPGQINGPEGFHQEWDYDGHGREVSVSTVLNGTTLTIRTTYDAASRVNSQTYPNGAKVYRCYNSVGLLSKVKEASCSSADTTGMIWKAVNYDAAGRILDEIHGNGVQTKYSYDSGNRLTEILSRNRQAQKIRHSQYVFDENDNLVSRSDLSQGTTKSETFLYDSLDRLTRSSVRDPGNSYGFSQNWQYDESGNILSNDELGLNHFQYDPSRSNAVIRAGNHTYQYDQNGNVIRKDGIHIRWTSYNKPTSFNTASGHVVFKYGPDRSRYLKINHAGDRVVYFGKLYEHHTDSKGSKADVFVYGPMGRLLAIKSTKKFKTGETNTTSFVHSDYMGSIDTLTSPSGSVLERLSYNAFGKRRAGDWRQRQSVRPATTQRGYTGHEHVDELGLIHMNGRVYDPDVGRFLSPDPHIQDPYDTQSFNRYTYARNNPLKYKDPSGFFFKKIFRSVKKFVKKYWRPIVAVAVSALTFGAATPYAAAFIAANTALTGTAAAVASGVLAGAASGFVGGVVSTGNVKGGLQGVVGGAIFGGVGGYFGSTWNIQRVASQAVAGGTVSELTSGKFVDGFVMAGVTATSRYLYNKWVSYDVTWKKGSPSRYKCASCMPVKGMNNIGTQGEKPDTSWFKGWKPNFQEGGGLSRALNRVPGINAVSGLHDVFQVKLDRVPFSVGGVGARDIFNVPGMPVAAVITYAGLLDGPQSAALIIDESKKKKEGG